MVARDDREFLASAARTNRALAASALPLINRTLAAADSHQLGVDLIALGNEFVRRAGLRHNTEAAIDGEVVVLPD